MRPAFEITAFKKKLLYFPYSHSDAARQQRRQRFTNRSALLHARPYTLRIEAYETSAVKRPTLTALWEYPVAFDYLPVYRFARVLRWPPPDHLRSSCHTLNCTDGDDRCENGYCAPGSLCRSDAPSDDGASSSPPYCICAANRHGRRCELQHDSCDSQPCLNGGSCFPTAQLNEVDCWCREEYYGSRCEWRKASIRLSVDDNATYAGAVVQFFDLNLMSVSLELVHQRVYSSLPPVIEYHREKETIPSIVVAKLYASHADDGPKLYLLSVQTNIKSLDGTTEISQTSHCPSRSNTSSLHLVRHCRESVSHPISPHLSKPDSATVFSTTIFTSASASKVKHEQNVFSMTTNSINVTTASVVVDWPDR